MLLAHTMKKRSACKKSIGEGAEIAFQCTLEHLRQRCRSGLKCLEHANLLSSLKHECRASNREVAPRNHFIVHKQSLHTFSITKDIEAGAHALGRDREQKERGQMCVLTVPTKCGCDSTPTQYGCTVTSTQSSGCILCPDSLPSVCMHVLVCGMCMCTCVYVHACTCTRMCVMWWGVVWCVVRCGGGVCVCVCVVWCGVV